MKMFLLKKSWINKKHIPKMNDSILRESGMSKGGQLDVRNPIVPIDL